MPNKNEKVIIMKIVEWIMGASIPLPIACKAIALPFELITLYFYFSNMVQKSAIDFDSG